MALLFWHGKRKAAMSKPRPSDAPRTIQTIKKLALSTFVIGTFAAYAIHENREGPNAVNSLNLPSGSSLPGAAANPPPNAPQSSGVRNANNMAQNSVQPNTNANSQTPRGLYQDGQYTGPVTNAYYGNVQVEAVIQNGRLTDVQ